ncbi:hypothetical protein ACIQC9_06305 [Brevundimonas sp. NPDC092305]|uniref:hypothetical protein n=1 Tax=Brevundimonas sp. NPDC092305 TaxID=3363957 RepID=UPI00382972F6
MPHLIRSLLILLGALATLTLGAAAVAVASPSTPPCHEAAMTHGDHGGQDEAPGKTMKAMACCAMCVTASLPLLTSDGTAETPTLPQPTLASSLNGRAPAPEPMPPRG